MTVRWERRHFDPGSIAYEGRILVGQVAKYAITEPGHTEILGHYFVGFVRGDRVTDRCETLEDAQEGVERSVSAAMPLR